MGIRIPLYTVISQTNNDELGAGSVGGGVIVGPFNLPQDIDNVVVKMTASIVGAGVSAQLQTTDDGGTTWFGVARTSIVSNAIGDNAQWLSVPVSGSGVGTGSIVATGSVIAGVGIGSAQPSTLSSGDVSGLPILSQRGRVIIQIVGNASTASITTQVKVNSQAAIS